MSRLTTDPTDPDLTHGDDAEKVEQAKAYLVMSAEDRAKGFVRPVRINYVHLRGEDGGDPPRVIVSMKGLVGCGVETRMSREIAETHARDPKFYSHTYCVGCKQHLPVAQFSWDDGTAVGS